MPTMSWRAASAEFSKRHRQTKGDNDEAAWSSHSLLVLVVADDPFNLANVRSFKAGGKATTGSGCVAATAAAGDV